MVIWKFQIALADKQQIAMPKGSEILAAGLQYGVMCIWARVNPDAPAGYRDIYIAGTGHAAPRPEDADHLATVIDGTFVWHVFAGK